MELVERYVKAVQEYLPEGQQKDIARELAENLRAQMEDQEESLGRPLTRAEQEAILKRMGNPALVAGRYQTNPQRLSFGKELIGPALYPTYLRVLVISLPLMLLGSFLANLVMGNPFEAAFPTMVTYAVVQFAIITGIFIGLQAHVNRYPDAWDPRDPGTPILAPQQKRLVSRTGSLVEIIIILVFVGIIRAFPATPPAFVVELGLGTVWTLGYWSFFGLTLASVAPPVIAFFCPTWIVFRAAARVIIDAAWIGVLLNLLVVGIEPSTHPLTEAVNDWLPWAIGAVAVVSVIELAYDIWKLIKARRLSKAS